jgi:hypothetical protein
MSRTHAIISIRTQKVKLIPVQIVSKSTKQQFIAKLLLSTNEVNYKSLYGIYIINEVLNLGLIFWTGQHLIRGVVF